MFLWAAVVLYAAVAWRLWARRGDRRPGGPHRIGAGARAPCSRTGKPRPDGSSPAEKLVAGFEVVMDGGASLASITKAGRDPSARPELTVLSGSIRSSAGWPAHHFLSADGQGGPMNTSHNSRGRSASRDSRSKALEERQVLSAGMGSTFAIMPGSDRPRQGKPRRSSSRSTPASSRRRAAARSSWASTSPPIPTSTVKPEIVSVTNASGQVAASVHHSVYTASIVKAQRAAKKGSRRSARPS